MSLFYSLPIKEIKALTTDSVEITFELSELLKEKFAFQAGQYITIKHIINGQELRRAYSICSAPQDGLKIAVKRIKGGRMSSYLTKDAKEKDVLELMPPSGNFILHSEKKVMAICAGSGITPILSMLKSSSFAEFTLIYGNKSVDETMYFSEIQRLGIKTYFAFSQEKIGENWHGRISEALLNSIPEIEQTEGFYLCGPEEMMEMATNFLSRKGIDKSKIFSERFFVDTKNKVNHNSSENEIMSNITVIKDGDEFSFALSSTGESILDSAISHGVDAPFACKGAVCCTCKAKVLEGKVKMDANYSLSQDEVEQGYILTCQSHPITTNVVVDYDEI